MDYSCKDLVETRCDVQGDDLCQVARDEEELARILNVVTPLEQKIECSHIIRDSPKRREEPPVLNYEQYRGIFNQTSLTFELELVKLAIALPGFTVSFRECICSFQRKSCKTCFLKEAFEEQ
ncbi:hypothetical protein OS493_016761 [Desmophyllum pertusum]|uniref:Uncharacterized protein n=1 Tax=Desmophyllum pertusum TaxID=174260 RepID=A0A9X0CSR9_9CNID|nr:hypothetical protein OS493_016761 [Desmophyllum pertusum]